MQKHEPVRLKPGKKYTSENFIAFKVVCGIHLDVDNLLYWVCECVHKDGVHRTHCLDANETYYVQEITTKQWLQYLDNSCSP